MAPIRKQRCRIIVSHSITGVGCDYFLLLASDRNCDWRPFRQRSTSLRLVTGVSTFLGHVGQRHALPCVHTRVDAWTSLRLVNQRSLAMRAEKRLSRRSMFLSTRDLLRRALAAEFLRRGVRTRPLGFQSEIPLSNYQLPVGKGQQFLNSSRAADLILGGWRLGGIFTVHERVRAVCQSQGFRSCSTCRIRR
jgi:hypothetical protein